MELDPENEENGDMPSDNPLLQRALELYAKDYKIMSIARELSVHPGTVRRWFKKVGLPAKRRDAVKPPKEIDDVQYVDETDEDADALEDNLDNYTGDAIRLAKQEARTVEDEQMMEIAESQASPADKYQHYIAAAGIKLLRDSMKNLKGPKSVRELSELDQLIRRNLGLNSKSGGGASSMRIDISILNNAKTDRGNGTISKMKPEIIDVELEPEQES
jgi:AraC-like DNA-binding protein